jgi:hypothetical protein
VDRYRERIRFCLRLCASARANSYLEANGSSGIFFAKTPATAVGKRSPLPKNFALE